MFSPHSSHRSCFQRPFGPNLCMKGESKVQSQRTAGQRDCSRNATVVVWEECRQRSGARPSLLSSCLMITLSLSSSLSGFLSHVLPFCTSSSSSLSRLSQWVVLCRSIGPVLRSGLLFSRQPSSSSSSPHRRLASHTACAGDQNLACLCLLFAVCVPSCSCVCERVHSLRPKKREGMRYSLPSSCCSTFSKETSRCEK